MGFISTNDQTSHGPGGQPGAWLRIALRFLQLVGGLTVCGLYGADLHSASSHGASSNTAWVYAVVVGGMSVVTTLLYFAPVIKAYALWPWDLLLFILWVAVFGTFAQKFLHANPSDYPAGHAPDYTRMHNAIWVDLANMSLWLISSVYGIIVSFFWRGDQTLLPGRVTV